MSLDDSQRAVIREWLRDFRHGPLTSAKVTAAPSTAKDVLEEIDRAGLAVARVQIEVSRPT